MSISNPNNENRHIRSEKLHPDIDMAEWSLEYLPSKLQYFKTDVDYIIRTRKNCIMIVELKKYGAEMSQCQKINLAILDQSLKDFNGKIVDIPDFGIIKVNYKGFHLLEIDGPRPDKCNTIKWNGVTIDHTTLINYLKFGENCKICFPKNDSCNC